MNQITTRRPFWGIFADFWPMPQLLGYKIRVSTFFDHYLVFSTYSSHFLFILEARDNLFESALNFKQKKLFFGA